jgi:hypothetical protein
MIPSRQRVNESAKETFAAEKPAAAFSVSTRMVGHYRHTSFRMYPFSPNHLGFPLL